ncbi:GNAT family N-acetyltransferase [Planomonospora corallina]|uniref:GNAT family N-acetyltransferase n=1 Tax=Planomonospora corallina TaxID=1806052 RepID=A0ABV8I7B2_9ACTN
MDPTIRRFERTDAAWARGLLTADFGSPVVVSRGVAHDATALPGFVAEVGGVAVGLATYRLAGNECEVVTISGHGVGAELLAAVVEQARRSECHRAWLVTTNDDLRALRFYQRQGWDLVALHRDAVTAARRIKPGIPEHGEDGIPIRHELELELMLEG